MASLTETAFYSRRIIKYGAVSLVVIIIGRVFLINAVKIYKVLYPPPEPPPTEGFGTLPAIKFPVTTIGELTYSLETPTTSLPNFPDRAEVFRMPAERPDILARENATTVAKGLGFDSKPEQVSNVLYRWLDTQPVNSTLDIQIYTGKFVMSIDWTSNPEFLSKKQLPSNEQAVVTVQSYLKQANLVPDDLAKAESRVSYLKASGKSFVPSISLSEADFVQVDLYRAKIRDTYTVITQAPDKGIVRSVLSGNPQLGRVIKVEYNYYAVNYDQFETYNLKPSDQAWQELQSGHGYTARLDKGVDHVVVRRMYLAYYDSFDLQPYLQPIYVFTGDDNYIGYISAVYTPNPTSSAASQ
jgi:hypothetical protein